MIDSRIISALLASATTNYPQVIMMFGFSLVWDNIGLDSGKSTDWTNKVKHFLENKTANVYKEIFIPEFTPLMSQHTSLEKLL